jgi:uncharacterized protein YjbI with pentapeptide repeats
MEPKQGRNAQQRKQPRWGFRGKTVWNWLEVLIVPLVLVVIGFLFTMQQDARQQQIEDQRAQQAQKLENQRAEAERELAEQSAQEEALQAYLDQVGTLLLEKDLRNSAEDSEVRTLARARTLTVLGRLDPSRKTEVVQFLVEAELIQSVKGRQPIIRLDGADLRGISVPGAGTLRGEALVILTLFDFHGVSLSAADLRDSNLSGADLSDAALQGADLSNADLSDADLSNAHLSIATLSDTDFNGADLSNAYLGGAHGLDYEKLAQQAKSLKGATMPTGQKYEDWIKDK